MAANPVNFLRIFRRYQTWYIHQHQVDNTPEARALRLDDMRADWHDMSDAEKIQWDIDNNGDEDDNNGDGDDNNGDGDDNIGDGDDNNGDGDDNNGDEGEPNGEQNGVINNDGAPTGGIFANGQDDSNVNEFLQNQILIQRYPDQARRQTCLESFFKHNNTDHLKDWLAIWKSSEPNSNLENDDARTNVFDGLGKENLVIGGAGVKLVAYVGAIAAIDKVDAEFLKRLKSVAGTSAGALIGLLVALGLSAMEIELLVLKQQNTRFMNIQWISILQNMIRGVTTLGLDDGENLREFVEEVIQKITGKSNLTFKELHELKEDKKRNRQYKDLSVCVTDLTTSEKISFDYKKWATQNVIISDAIRASISIPGIYYPHFLYIKNQGVRYKASDHSLVDGYLVENVPFSHFKEEKHTTLGLMICSSEEKHLFELDLKPQQATKSGLLELGKAVEYVISNYQQNLNHLENAAQTIHIRNCGVSGGDSKITEDKKRELFKAGWDDSARFMGRKNLIGKYPPFV